MKRTQILALLALAAVAACGGSGKKAEPAAETAGNEQPTTTTEVIAEAPRAEPGARAPAPEMPLPSLAVIVTHRVKDFDAWKDGFDAGQAARQEAGILAHQIHRGVKDQNLVVVYLVATDLDKVKTFMAGPALKDTMKNAGVIGKPTIEIVTPVENHTATDATLPALLISHEVKDFDAWKAGFDEDNASRTEAGIVGYAVNRDQAKPNLVMVYAQAKTSDALNAFAASPELKAKMKAGGVKGKPKVTLVQGVEWGQYTK